MKYLLHLFNTPSDFGDDWKAYARNVALHVFAIGLLSASSEAAFPGFGFAIGAVAYALIWEIPQWYFKGGDPADCVEDWAFVQSGALAYLTADPRVIAIAAGFLISGVLRRM